MADQKILLGNVRGEQGPAGPNTVSGSTTTSGFENGHVLFNNNGKVGAKKLSASDVGALAADGTAEKAKKITSNGTDFEAWKLQAKGYSGDPGNTFLAAQAHDYVGYVIEGFSADGETSTVVAVDRLRCMNAENNFYDWGLKCQFYTVQSAFRLSCIGNDGEIPCFVDVAGRVASSSSERYKTEIQPVAEELLDAVLDLDVIDFLYNESAPENVRDNKRHFGVIAEQVAKIIPDSVTLDGEGLPSAVVYSDFIPLLLAQLQRQQKQLAELEQRIRQLEEGNRE